MNIIFEEKSVYVLDKNGDKISIIPITTMEEVDRLTVMVAKRFFNLGRESIKNEIKTILFK